MSELQNSESEPSTTGLARLHTNIGREGCIVELRAEEHVENPPTGRDMSHLSKQKASELYDQLDDYLHGDD